MLETPHVIVAAAIAYKLKNPALALPLAFGSHFILEKVPHWNPHLNTEIKKYGKLTPLTMKIIVIDSVIALITGLYIASLAMPDYQLALTILFSCFMGVLPDVAEAPYFLWGWKVKPMEKLVRLQKLIQNDTSPLPGILTQVATFFAAILWIFSG